MLSISEASLHEEHCVHLSANEEHCVHPSANSTFLFNIQAWYTFTLNLVLGIYTISCQVHLLTETVSLKAWLSTVWLVWRIIRCFWEVHRFLGCCKSILWRVCECVWACVCECVYVWVWVSVRECMCVCVSVCVCEKQFEDLVAERKVGR